MKYRPEFPDRFGSIQEARVFRSHVLNWYNNEHHHGGIGLLTPQQVHAGRAEDIRQKRQAVLDKAHAKHPHCFVRSRPRASQLPAVAWINPPKTSQMEVA
ncbi:MAG: hypothetical protein K9H25_19635 [Rhodospirillum sp.]|nr:hypothetical protein [Rhodospirillum sp.]MCF8491292.1 hypothetical protein [Rhodospirillum sp.]MCF8501012.1 hypothetical protein [Rhodospirillum sp.]